jgi:hypothetical protein
MKKITKEEFLFTCFSMLKQKKTRRRRRRKRRKFKLRRVLLHPLLTNFLRPPFLVYFLRIFSSKKLKIKNKKQATFFVKIKTCLFLLTRLYILLTNCQLKKCKLENFPWAFKCKLLKIMKLFKNVYFFQSGIYQILKALLKIQKNPKIISKTSPKN